MPQFQGISPMVAKCGFSNQTEKQIQNVYHIQNFILNNVALCDRFYISNGWLERSKVVEFALYREMIPIIFVCFENSYFASPNIRAGIFLEVIDRRDYGPLRANYTESRPPPYFAYLDFEYIFTSYLCFSIQSRI